MVFRDRQHAGNLLTEKLSNYPYASTSLVLSIPRGGVVIGAVIAKVFDIPMDVLITKKIGSPDNEELAIGAIAENGEPVIDKKVIDELPVESAYLQQEIGAVHMKIQRYVQLFRSGNTLDVKGKNVIVTDDGVATGYTMEAALTWLGVQQCTHIALAVPVIATDAFHKLQPMVDFIFYLELSNYFGAVGQFYHNFNQVEDSEVVRILAQMKHS